MGARGGMVLAVGLLMSGAAMAQPVGDVDPALCQALGVRHRPAPDVEYVPGFDVRGNKVAPADLPGSYGASGQRLDHFEIPLTLDFARRMGWASGGHGTQARLPGATEIGRITIDGDRVSLNGQPLDGQGRGALIAACQRRR